MQKIYLLHGWSQDNNNKEKWLPLIEILKNKKVEGIFLPIPGLNFNIDKVWQLNDYLEWLSKTLPEKEKAILLGHSFGGQISTLYASLNPNRVEKLILLDSAGIKNNTLKVRVKRIIFYPIAKIGKIFFKADKFRKFLYKMAREHDYEQADPNLRKTFLNVKNNEILENLKDIKCPTLILWGQNDKITPAFMAHLFNKRINNSKLYFIKEGRHSPQFTHPDIVADKIITFLKK